MCVQCLEWLGYKKAGTADLPFDGTGSASGCTMESFIHPSRVHQAGRSDLAASIRGQGNMEVDGVF